MGKRVAAIFGTKEKILLLFGYGSVSEEIPDESAAKRNATAMSFRESGRTNPCITIEEPEALKGQKIYGCECWWGDAEKVEETYQGYEKRFVSLKEAYEGKE